MKIYQTIGLHAHVATATRGDALLFARHENMSMAWVKYFHGVLRDVIASRCTVGKIPPRVQHN